ncbi:MAG: hypothetical protein V3W18_06285 [candidate division Zixibacteria bacterium]
MPRRDLIIITTTFLICCAYYFLWSLRSTYPGFPLDDSWIHMVFARNIATGHGFSFNPDVPIAGATAPLWTLMVTIFWIIAGPVAGGIAAGVISEWLAIIGIYKLATLLAKDRTIALFTALTSILLWPVIWGSLSGMEVGLFTALTIWGLFLYFRSRRFSDIYIYSAYLCFTLSFLARPETAVFLGAVILRDLYEWIKSENKTLIPWGIRLLVIILPLLPYFIFNYQTTGSIFPLTYNAKIKHKGLLSSLLNLDTKRIIKALTIFPVFYFQDFYRKVLTLNPVVILAIIPGFIRLIPGNNHDRSKRIMLVLSILMYLPLMGSFVPMYTATFQGFRTSSNLLPLLVFVGALGLFPNTILEYRKIRKGLLIAAVALIAVGISTGIVFKSIDQTIAPQLLEDPTKLDSDEYLRLYDFAKDTGFGAAIFGGLILAGFFMLSSRFQKFQMSKIKIWRNGIAIAAIIAGLANTIPRAATYADNVKNINECDVEAGLYLGRLAQPGDIVAINDVGAIGYYSNMEILDLKGLISPEFTIEMIDNDSLEFEYMSREKQVDYLAIMPNWFDYIPDRTDIFTPIREFITDNNTILARDTTIVYKAVWPDSTD